MYKKEKQLVNEFKKRLKKTRKKDLKCISIATEFYYRSGKTDIIANTLDGSILAFEAKLIKWKDALQQAYRNTTYAHYSYVILPYYALKNAIKWQREFERRNVGLCTVKNSSIIIEIPASKVIPNSSWLTEEAHNLLQK